MGEKTEADSIGQTVRSQTKTMRVSETACRAAKGVVPNNVFKGFKILSKWAKDSNAKMAGHVGMNYFQMAHYVKAVQTKVATVVENQQIRVCETGFNAGHSAMLFLQASQRVSYLGFDLGDVPAARMVAPKLLDMFGGDRFQIVWGNTRKTLADFFRKNPGILCDIIVLDGEHTYEGVLNDFNALSLHGRTIVWSPAQDKDQPQKITSSVAATCLVTSLFRDVSEAELEQAQIGHCSNQTYVQQPIAFFDDCRHYKNRKFDPWIYEAYEDLIKTKRLESIAELVNTKLSSPGYCFALLPQLMQ